MVNNLFASSEAHQASPGFGWSSFSGAFVGFNVAISNCAQVLVPSQAWPTAFRPGKTGQTNVSTFEPFAGRVMSNRRAPEASLFVEVADAAKVGPLEGMPAMTAAETVSLGNASCEVASSLAHTATIPSTSIWRLVVPISLMAKPAAPSGRTAI